MWDVTSFPMVLFKARPAEWSWPIVPNYTSPMVDYFSRRWFSKQKGSKNYRRLQK